MAIAHGIEIKGSLFIQDKKKVGGYAEMRELAGRV
jgi:hypothetical protein